ncbi:tRNA 2-thiouridine(34) synthase MnmA [Lawsonella clevelandensis]|uniref:tRNA 2-thiouridine(34) synthase MnmA n=1 Tax=Lawsonella clevelandensis TaxID=1528099 RepID=UPI0023F05739|nr:tRNA 2-thiouridine(34) synthase MnmA [Lawsonella clevelandensis]
MRVLAALSGGVDSSVAAARLVDAGHDVVGIHLALSSAPATLRTGARGCCSLEDSGDARRVADQLGIPFYVWDFSARFRAQVIEDFVDTYELGETPNPCLRCNERIKFDALLERGLALGYDAVATGHYAQIVDGMLRRGVDQAKDQSYVLGVLNRHQLDHSLFPCGDTEKPQIREEAAAYGFSVASKPDSTDICFIPNGDTRGFLHLRLGDRPGPVIDMVTGDTVAEHRGTYGFTIGQRKGLGLAGPLPDGLPRYVVGLDVRRNTVLIGTRDMLETNYLQGWPANWLSRELADCAAAGERHKLRCEVQVRAHAAPVPCTVEMMGETVTIHTVVPLRGVACGQSAVLYQPDPVGDLVLGSATIHATAESYDTLTAQDSTERPVSSPLSGVSESS